MPIIDHTPGGSPIIWPNPQPERRKGNRNKRLKCKACGHSTTKNQRKANGNRCFQCKLEFRP